MLNPILLDETSILLNAVYDRELCCQKDLVIFNQIITHDEIGIYLDDNLVIEEEFNKHDIIDLINQELSWLYDAKDKIISAYQQYLSCFDWANQQDVNEEWYHTLEIYGVSFFITKQKSVVINISAGDNIFADHILEMQIEQGGFVEFFFDG